MAVLFLCAGPTDLTYQGQNGSATATISETNKNIVMELRTTKKMVSFLICEDMGNGQFEQSRDFSNKATLFEFTECISGTPVRNSSKPRKVFVTYIGPFPFRPRRLLITSATDCSAPLLDAIHILLDVTGTSCLML